MRAFLVGLPIGWMLGALIFPLTMLGVITWILYHPELLKKFSDQLLDSIQSVLAVDMERTSMG